MTPMHATLAMPAIQVMKAMLKHDAGAADDNVGVNDCAKEQLHRRHFISINIEIKHAHEHVCGDVASGGVLWLCNYSIRRAFQFIKITSFL